MLSFYFSEAKKRLLRGSEYGFFLDFADLNSMFSALVRNINEQFAAVLISDALLPDRLEGIARDMNLILGAGGKLDRTWTKRALSDKFSIRQDRKHSHTNIMRKIPGQNLYPERRYWDQEQTLAFCIAARLPYDQAQMLLGPMLGQPWLYLRDPFTLTCDFALRTSLSAGQTAQLLAYTLTALDGITAEIPDANGTAHIRDLYNLDVLPKVLSGEAEPMDAFREFIDYEKHNLRGDFSRTCALIRDLIQGRTIPALGLFPDQLILNQYLTKGGEISETGTPMLSTAHLGLQLSKTFVPWERKGSYTKTDGRNIRTRELLTPAVESDKYLQRRIRAYLKPEPDYSSIGFSEMRNDLLRLLLMYGTVTTIHELNLILIDHSFCALNPELPFDFLVCASLVYGTGPRRNDSNSNPYAALIQLMNYYRTWSAGRSSPEVTGGFSYERE